MHLWKTETDQNNISSVTEKVGTRGISELIGLNVGSINEKEMLIKVLGKGNKVRIIPFGKEAKKAIFKSFAEALFKINSVLNKITTYLNNFILPPKKIIFINMYLW